VTDWSERDHIYDAMTISDSTVASRPMVLVSRTNGSTIGFVLASLRSSVSDGARHIEDFPEGTLDAIRRVMGKQ
jgi:hypothetical protein